MESKQKQQQRLKPKLERRNAIKNIDYQVDDSSTSSSIRTRSLDVSFYASSSDNRTSFRIVGGSDAEIDRICWNLGLSGPEDFAIPTAAWEARKTKSSSSATSSSSIFPHSRFHQLSHDTPPSPPSTADIGIELKQDEDDEVKGKELSTGDSSTGPTKNVSSSSSSSSSSIAGARGGIKGVRPPTLAPPPSILLPPIDDNLSGSTWDILRDFGPPQDNNRSASKARIVDTTSSSDDDDDDDHHKYPIEEEEEESSRAIVEREEDLVRLGETSLHLSESCSFSDEGEDGDSSSTTTDPMYVISPNAISRFRRNINSWTKGTLLGSGSFGTVYEGLSEDGFFFAVKEVSLLDQGIQAKQSIHQLEQEISLLSQFEHENIVQYLGTDKDDGKLYIFLELVTQGSLAQLYQKYHLPENLVSAYTRQILHGLKYLHDRNVVHRDIKCANILVDASGYVKLADFGLAKATKFNDVKSCKGTAFWMAPEVVNRRNHGYGLPADIWSLGCTVLEMLTRQLPYLNLECMQALFRIGRGKPPPIPDSISGAARDFILQCLQVNADDRPTAALLLEHAFVDRPSSAPSGSVSPAHNNWRRT